MLPTDDCGESHQMERLLCKEQGSVLAERYTSSFTVSQLFLLESSADILLPEHHTPSKPSGPLFAGACDTYSYDSLGKPIYSCETTRFGPLTESMKCFWLRKF